MVGGVDAPPAHVAFAVREVAFPRSVWRVSATGTGRAVTPAIGPSATTVAGSLDTVNERAAS